MAITDITGATFAEYAAAIRNGARQHIKVVFEDGTTLTDADIDITSGGLKFTEVLNGDSDLTIGRAVMSQAELHFINDNNALSGTNFEQTLTVYLGVEVNNATNYQPLGVFNGKKPSKVLSDTITLQADDNMSRMEFDATGFLEGLAYPITLSGIFYALCDAGNVPYATVTSKAVNASKSFAAPPMNDAGMTGRDLLTWIAEANGCYARANRYGSIELVFPTSFAYTLVMTDYFSIDAAEYTVPQIGKLQVKVTENDIGVIVPSGSTATNGYIIVDNPFLFGDSDSAIRPYATNIYDQLHGLGIYTPASIEAECNWLLQAGDIISVQTGTNKYITYPIFSQEITFNGHAMVSYQTEGSAELPAVTASNSRKIIDGARFHEIQNDIGTLRSTIQGIGGDVSEISQELGNVTIRVEAVENTQIGGRNYLRNSSDLDYSGYYIASAYTRNDPYIGFGEIDYAELED